MQITKEMIDLAISLNACEDGIERAKLGFEFLTFQDRCWIARQKETPVFLLEKLSTDEVCSVRCHVARNPSTPVSLLEKLSTDKWWIVRYNVAEHSTKICKTPGTMFNMEAHGNTISFTIILPCNQSFNESQIAELEKIFHDEAERILAWR